MAKVTIYTTVTCQYCILAKRYLEKNGIAFEAVDVTSDPAKAEALAAKAGENRTPIFIIDKDGQEEVIAGFDKGRLDHALGLSDA